MRWRWLEAVVVCALFAGLMLLVNRHARGEAILPLSQGSSSSGTTGVTSAKGGDGVLVNGTTGTPQTGAVLIDLGSTLTFDTINSNPGQPITLDAASGVVAVAAGDTFTADSATIGTVTSDIVFTDRVSAKSPATALALRETSGIVMADDTATAATISTWTPTANTLTLNIAGTGTFTLDPTDTFTASSATITTLTVTSLTSTNTTATNIFVDNVYARSGGATKLALHRTVGVEISADDGTGATIFTPTATKMTIDAPGSGTVAIASGDTFTSPSATITVIAFTTASGTTLVTTNVTDDWLFIKQITGQTAGAAVKLLETSGVEIADDAETAASISTLTPGANSLTLAIAGSGVFVIDATEKLEVDNIESTTNNSTITIIGRGTGGVSFSTEPVLISNLDGTGGADANEDIMVRRSGKYIRFGKGSNGQALLIDSGGQVAYGTPAGTITVGVTTTSFTGSTAATFNSGSPADLTGNVIGQQTSTTTNVTIQASPAYGWYYGLKARRTANTTLSVTLDAILLQNDFGTQKLYKDIANEVVDITVTGAGGLRSGLSEASNTHYLVWAIGKENGTFDLILDTSSTALTRPGDYPYQSRLPIAWVRNDGSSNFEAFEQTGAFVYLDLFVSGNHQALNGGSSTTRAPVSLASFVPIAAKSAIFGMVTRSTGTGVQSMNGYLDDTLGAFTIQLLTATLDGGGSAPSITSYMEAPCDGQRVYYHVNGANDRVDLYVVGARLAN